jgi:hypothetical protein
MHHSVQPVHVEKDDSPTIEQLDVFDQSVEYRTVDKSSLKESDK